MYKDKELIAVPKQMAYNHILVVVDAFSEFVWLYPTKWTDSKAIIDSLEKQSAIFGNPERIIAHRGTAFTSQTFEDYFKYNKIHLIMEYLGVITKWMHKILVHMLTKFYYDKP